MVILLKRNYEGKIGKEKYAIFFLKRNRIRFVITPSRKDLYREGWIKLTSRLDGVSFGCYLF